MRLGALAGSFTSSGTTQCLLVNFTDELKQLEVNNYCWSSVCGSGVSSVSTLGMLPMQPGLLRCFVSLGEAGRAGVCPTPAPSTACGSSWAGVSCTSRAALSLPSSSSYNHWHTSSASPYFYFPFLFPSFPFFPPFLFFSRSYQGWVTPGSPTQSICAHSALTCICHSLYTHTFGHVTSISQFAFPLYFILPLVSLCQKKAEGGAVRKTFLL